MLKKIFGFLILIVALFGLNVSVSAKDASVPDNWSKFGNITLNDGFTSLPVQGQGRVLSNNYEGVTRYPWVKEIRANGIINGRISTNTTKIITWIVDRPYLKHGGIGLAQYSLLVKTNDGELKKINLHPDRWGNTSSQNYNGTAGRLVQFDVNLTNLKELLPIYIGMVFTNPDDATKLVTIGIGHFGKNTKIPIKPTIKRELKPDDQIIIGTGAVPGDKISTNFSNETTIVNEDGTYTLHLMKNLSDYLALSNYVQIIESNDNGDYGTSEKQQQLKVTKSEPQPSFYLEDSNSINDWINKTDDVIIMDLCKKFSIRVTNAELANDADVKFESETKNISQKIAALQNGQTLDVRIQAFKDGWISSTPIDIKIVQQEKILSLKVDQTKLIFPAQQVPLVPTSIFYPKNWSIMVTDTRSKRDGWKLKAQTIDAKTARVGDHNLNSYLFYENRSSSSNTEDSLNHQITILDNPEKSDQDKISPYPINFDSNRSIFIKAQPDMYSGTYVGDILWTLEIGPNTTT